MVIVFDDENEKIDEIDDDYEGVGGERIPLKSRFAESFENFQNHLAQTEALGPENTAHFPWLISRKWGWEEWRGERHEFLVLKQKIALPHSQILEYLYLKSF